MKEPSIRTSSQPWRDIWYAYRVTGLRKMELARLVFSDVDGYSRERIRGLYRKKNTPKPSSQRME